MGEGASTGRGGLSAPAALRRLLPAGEPASAEEIVQELGLWRRPALAEHPARPRVLLNMISTADGRATIAGHSGGLSGRADRELFHALRAPVDAVLVGAGTVRSERYGRLIRAEPVRRVRVERGLREEPLACIVSGRLQLEPDIPLFADPASHVVMLTPSEGTLAEAAARVDYIRAPAAAGGLDLAAALAELRASFAVQLALCEGGPHLAGDLLAAGLLDELFLSMSPRLLGGAEPRESLRILAGAELSPPVELELCSVLESDSQLFLRYAVVASERV